MPITVHEQLIIFHDEVIELPPASAVREEGSSLAKHVFQVPILDTRISPSHPVAEMNKCPQPFQLYATQTGVVDVSGFPALKLSILL